MTQEAPRYGTPEWYENLLRDAVGGRPEFLGAAALGAVRSAVYDVTNTQAGDALAGRHARRIIAAHDKVMHELTGYDRNAVPAQTGVAPRLSR